NSYIHWYNERRIKLSLQAMSPVNYRRHLGIAT
ncbi:IS3 family transposase, partial [Cupriavidus necator]